MNAFDAQVLEVARIHGTMAAADWSGLSRSTVIDLRKTHDGYQRGRGHPTRAELDAAKPRHSCPCPRCTDWRTEKTEHRAALAATMDHLVGTDEEWRLSAACLGEDPDLFFPGVGQSATEARAICARCPVTEPCLRYALDNHGTAQDVGIFGGTSARERKRLRRRESEVA